MIPPPPPPTPGTLEWAEHHLTHTFDAVSAQDIRDLVNNPSSQSTRVLYSMLCHKKGWKSWEAKLAWSVIQALQMGRDEDIPF